jgi:hypothetical protein
VKSEKRHLRISPPLPGFRSAPPGLRKKRKQNAGRRLPTLRTIRVRAPRHTGAACAQAERTRLPAFHRGTCGATERRRSAPVNALPGRRRHQVLPASSPIPVHPLSGSPVVVPGGRIGPEPPECAGHEPAPAGTALAPPPGVTDRRPSRARCGRSTPCKDKVKVVALTVTIVLTLRAFFSPPSWRPPQGVGKIRCEWKT